MAKEGFEELRAEGQRLLGTSVNHCNAACSQATLTSHRAPAELQHARLVQLRRSVCSPSPPWLGLPAAASGEGCSDLTGTMLPGLVLNVSAGGNFIFSIYFQRLTIRVVQPPHRSLGSTRAAQRNKWFLLEVVESLPQNSFLSVNAHVINLKCSTGR